MRARPPKHPTADLLDRVRLASDPVAQRLLEELARAVPPVPPWHRPR